VSSSRRGQVGDGCADRRASEDSGWALGVCVPRQRLECVRFSTALFGRREARAVMKAALKHCTLHAYCALVLVQPAWLIRSSVRSGMSIEEEPPPNSLKLGRGLDGLVPRPGQVPCHAGSYGA